MLTDKQAVIFDLDGTLADSMWVWAQIDKDFFLERGMTFPEDLNQCIEGMSFEETARYFIDRFHIEDYTLQGLMDHWNNMAIEKYRTEVPVKEGASEYLAFVKGQGLKTGISTSNCRMLVELFLQARGLDGYIDAITTSDEVEKGKPAPDVYLATAKKLGVTPENCLVFEDVPMGIHAGHNAGMTVCGIEDRYSAHLREEKQQLADYYIEDFRELL